MLGFIMCSFAFKAVFPMFVLPTIHALPLSLTLLLSVSLSHTHTLPAPPFPCPELTSTIVAAFARLLSHVNSSCCAISVLVFHQFTKV